MRDIEWCCLHALVIINRKLDFIEYRMRELDFAVFGARPKFFFEVNVVCKVASNASYRFHLLLICPDNFVDACSLLFSLHYLNECLRNCKTESIVSSLSL